MSMFYKNKKEQKYFIYFAFSRYLEAGDYDLEELGFENLTLEEAKIKLEEIRIKVKNRSVETTVTKRGLSRLINWAVLDDAYIEEH